MQYFKCPEKMECSLQLHKVQYVEWKDNGFILQQSGRIMIVIREQHTEVK